MFRRKLMCRQSRRKREFGQATEEFLAATAELTAFLEGADGKPLNLPPGFSALCRRMKSAGFTYLAALEAYRGAQNVALKAEPRYNEAERAAIQAKGELSAALGRDWAQTAVAAGAAGEAWLKADAGMGFARAEEEEFIKRSKAFTEAHSAFIERAKAVRREASKATER
jgi:hypothetical protein